MVVTLPNLKVISLRRAKILLGKVAKIYRRFYVGGLKGESKFVAGPHRQANACKISKL